MLQIVIHWTYYKENVWFSAWNCRQKKECVFFYDYDDLAWYIIWDMDYSDLQKFRFNIYRYYQKEIKFTPFRESDKDWNLFEWYKLQSPIIELDSDTLARLLPSRELKKRFFIYDNVREKYFYKSKFINYIKNPCLM